MKINTVGGPAVSHVKPYRKSCKMFIRVAVQPWQFKKKYMKTHTFSFTKSVIHFVFLVFSL